MRVIWMEFYEAQRAQWEAQRRELEESNEKKALFNESLNEVGMKLHNAIRRLEKELESMEREANVFASRLLAPACVLWALDVKTPEQIAALCRISHQSASFRAERMQILYQRNRFLSSPLERKVYEQFTEFIRHQKDDL